MIASRRLYEVGDYTEPLERLDSTWRDMRAAGDLDGLRQRCFAAVVFALCSVHTPVAESEREFTDYMRTGALPEGTMLAEQKSSGIIAAIRWIDTTSVETFDADGWALADTILRNVYGLGTAKSAFASALCGNPEPYCIDTHGADLIAARTGAAYGRIINSIYADKSAGTAAVSAAWRRYRRWGDTTFGARNHQWEYFAMKVPEFRTGGHAAYFDEALIA